MSDGVVITLIVCATIVVVAALNAVIKVRTVAPAATETVQHWPGVESRIRHLPLPEEPVTRQYVEEQVETSEANAPLPAPALPIDPANPPRRMSFPRTGGEPPRCECHKRKINPGQDVYAWPVEDGYRFTCAEDGR
jgi:hypothetical protein